MSVRLETAVRGSGVLAQFPAANNNKEEDAFGNMHKTADPVKKGHEGEYGKILDLGITSNVEFPNTFGHPIRTGHYR